LGDREGERGEISPPRSFLKVGAYDLNCSLRPGIRWKVSGDKLYIQRSHRTSYAIIRQDHVDRDAGAGRSLGGRRRRVSTAGNERTTRCRRVPRDQRAHPRTAAQPGWWRRRGVYSAAGRTDYKTNYRRHSESANLRQTAILNFVECHHLCENYFGWIVKLGEDVVKHSRAMLV